MPSVATILQKMRNNPKNIAFRDLIKVSKAYFGEPRIHGSHHFFKTPWIGDPLVNLQEGRNGSAKPYQVRQVLAAIENWRQNKMSIPREELYTYRVEWSEEDQEFVGTVAEFPSLSCLADSSLEALSGIQQVVLQAINILEEEGKPVPEPYRLRQFSGRFNLRVSPQLHRKLSQQAAFAHQSLNQYVSHALEAAA